MNEFLKKFAEFLKIDLDRVICNGVEEKTTTRRLLEKKSVIVSTEILPDTSLTEEE